MIIETNRLILRPWKETDAENLFAYAKDPDVGPAAGWQPHTSVEYSREVILRILSVPETYAIVYKETGEAVGSISLMFGDATDLAQNENECELGYWLGKPLWGQGLVPEAGRVLLRHAFQDLQVNKVWCGYYDGNIKSKRVQEKLGFRYQWTTEKVDVPQMNEVRKGHVNCLTKDIWEIRNSLYSVSDAFYRSFQAKLVPTVAPDSIIGVRIPALKDLAKKLCRQGNTKPFLNDLPHLYYDENQLHAFILSNEKDFDTCIDLLDRFLPYVDNWATCDSLSPKVFRKNRERLLPHIQRWIRSGETYKIRFAVKMLMDHFLGDMFDVSYPERLCEIVSEEYYVNMMIAWYFATALAKQYDATIPFLKEKRLPPQVHNKTIQKALESYRIPDDRKTFLRSLKN